MNKQFKTFTIYRTVITLIAFVYLTVTNYIHYFIDAGVSLIMFFGLLFLSAIFIAPLSNHNRDIFDNHPLKIEGYFLYYCGFSIIMVLLHFFITVIVPKF